MEERKGREGRGGEKRGRRRKNFTLNKKGWEPALIGIFESRRLWRYQI